MARRFDGVEGIEWVGFDPAPHQKGEKQRSLFSAPAAQEG
jgi:site-specific DNA-methyltransferase (adenine-specific)